MTYRRPPARHTWEQRRSWFESRIAERPGMPESVLLGDIEACFCTGAWLAVLLLCRTVIETQLRQAQGANAAQAPHLRLEVIDADPELAWLRQECEALLGLPPQDRSRTMGERGGAANAGEGQARRAVEVLLRVFNRTSRWI